MNKDKGCCCPCHRMLGIFVILVGLSFLLKHLGVISDHMANIVWPVVVILIGIKKTFSGMCKCCSDGKSCSTDQT